MPQQLDQDAVNLTKAIRQTESGGNFTAQGKSGEYGAYQYTRPTWESDSSAAGVSVPLEQATPEQQNQVAYTKIKALKDQGYNVGQIASIWNSGKPDAYLDPSETGTNSYGAKYDVPAYAKSVATAYQSLKQGMQVGVDPNNPSSIANEQNQAPSLGGFGHNLVQSGANFLGNLTNAAFHPVQTVQNLGLTAAGGLQELGGQQNENTQKWDALKNYFVNRYNSPEALGHTIYSDPIGFAADLSTVLGGVGGVAGAVGKGAEIAGLTDAADVAGSASSALNTASKFTNPLTPIGSGIGKVTSSVAPALKEEFAQVLGIQPSTIDTKLQFPEEVTAENAMKYSREALAQQVKDSLQNKFASYDETGAAYNPLRNSSLYASTNEGDLAKIIENASGAIIDDRGSVLPGGRVTDPYEIRALQNFYDTWKQTFASGDITPDELLNMRGYAARKLAKFDNAVVASPNLKAIGSEIYAQLNNKFRPSFSGMEQLDSVRASQINEIKDLGQGILKKNGEFRDNFVNTISNATGKGKSELLDRLETLSPGIGNRLRIMKAIEDISNSGLKVGSYTRTVAQAARLGGAVAGLATGNVKMLTYALLADFISRPEVAMSLLKAVAKVHPEVVGPLLHEMMRYLTMGSVASASGINSQEQGKTGSQLPPESIPSQGMQSNLQTEESLGQSYTTDSPEVQAALKAGYSLDEIKKFLSQ